MFATRKLLGTKSLLARASNYVIKGESRASYVRGLWPEPITQPTLEQFLEEINYFEEPKEFINIGLKLDKAQHADTIEAGQERDKGQTIADVDEILKMLGDDAELPELDLDDAMVNKDQLMRLAVSSGIYRDLFGDYQPNRNHINFTPEQAKKLYDLVPSYWITDQPFARVARTPRKLDPIHYFEPLVRVSARFVHNLGDAAQDEKYCHTVYHGNVIPAHEAKVKPSIVIDGRDISSITSGAIRESQFENWEPGHISRVNFQGPSTESYHTVLLLNLDSLHPKSANLHWMLANISQSSPKAETRCDEVCDYLPVHGIRGFGYSRYVFLVMQHKSPLDTSKLKIKDFKMESRRFDVKDFLDRNKSIDMVPVGLSWFQTIWDESSNEVFHQHMNMRSPVYEHVQTALEKREMLNMAYPGKIPFHIFMDHNRDKKETNERVLLERLKQVDPFDYKDQYVKPKVPPTVFTDDDEGMPSWMVTVMFKKKNKIGDWRGLRPASATIPLNNNADLDNPQRPFLPATKQLPASPNLYPGPVKRKTLKNQIYSKPVNEHTNVYVNEGNEIFVDEVKKMVNDLEEEKK